MFSRTYWFNSSKGVFRLYVSKESREVRIEVQPSKFVSVKELWITKTTGLKEEDEIQKVKAKHIEEYESMLNRLDSFTELSHQDEYILLEMKSQGYTLLRR